MISIRKILQSLYYIQSKAPSDEYKYNIMYLLKLLYFADRYHIRHFGYAASGDKYIAMRYGPVASAAKDILQGKMPNSANSAEISLINDDVEPLSEFDFLLIKQEEDELSESFKQALDFSLDKFGTFTQYELSSIAHVYPEWEKFEERLKRNEIKSAPMDFADFFDNPKSLDKLKECGVAEDPFKENDSEFLNLLKIEFNASSL
jgi:uncharacterized phage-associated protein